MSSLNLRRLQYTLQYRTSSWLASRLGVSYQQVTAWGRGLGTIASDVYTPLRNAFQTVSYNNLRLAGANTRIAKNYSTRSPEGVVDAINILNNMVERSTENYFGSWTWENDITPSQSNFKRYYEDLRSDVIRGMQKSIYNLNELKERYNG